MYDESAHSSQQEMRQSGPSFPLPRRRRGSAVATAASKHKMERSDCQKLVAMWRLEQDSTHLTELQITLRLLLHMIYEVVDNRHGDADGKDGNKRKGDR